MKTTSDLQSAIDENKTRHRNKHFPIYGKKMFKDPEARLSAYSRNKKDNVFGA